MPKLSSNVKHATEEELPLPMPELRQQISYASCESSIVVCPGKAAAKRLHQFEHGWIPRSARSVNTSANDDTMAVDEDDLLIKHILGNGGFSTVSRVYIRNTRTGQYDSEQSFAMKKLKARNTGDFSSWTTAASDFALETKILKNLRHENIIQLRGVKAGDMIQSLKEGTFYIILDELVETLDTRLERWNTSAKTIFIQSKSTVSTNRRLREVALGVADGMAYLHSKNIMFR